MGHDIFISYAREDLERVQPLAKAIESLGYSVWWDDTDLRAGNAWREEIEQAISAARCVAVIWTQAAADSRSVRAEISFAQKYDKKLMQISIERAVPSPALASTQSVDVAGWDGRPEHASFQLLIRAIAQLAGPPPRGVEPVQAETRPQTTRRLRIQDIAWVEIRGGPFIYQSGETRELPTFRIARYPVTNAQYQTFVDDGGYGEPRWWTDLKRPEPQASNWPQANRPRTNVDWYEAVAFTRWLNARLRLAEGRIRLPTELEWEEAARGKQGRAYPWGNEYRSGLANVDERGAKQGEWYLEQTTAVGLYPEGRSPHGIEDMAGTVWEWCLNKYEDPAAIAPDTSGASRALRGGSWLHDPVNARAVYRLRYHPDDRNINRGFRLLSSVPIEPVR